MSLHRFPVLFPLAASFLSLLPSATVYADDDTYPDFDSRAHGVARLSVMAGNVSIRRGDSGDYVAAAVNAPLVAGDTIAVGPAGRAELQFDSADMLRLGHDSEVRLTDIQYNRIGMQVARGTVTFRVLRDSPTQIELSTPTVSVRPAGRGSYRVTVLEDGQTEITVRSGQVEIFTPRGVEQLRAGQTMLARGSASDPEFQIVSAIPRDEWDNWNEGRDRELEASVSYGRVSSDIYGVEDLDPYGRWVSDPTYGQVWAPNVAAGWAPYRDGRWVWIDYYGWTWLGDEPWGWAPYHYGRWFYGSPGWCWYPGPIYSHAYWSPALVGFFGFGRGGYNSFHFGFDNLGWAPLAPHESFHRWWGRGGGFGRGFNIVNGGSVFNSYRNARVLNAVTGIRSEDFGAGRFRHFAVSRNQFSEAGLVRGGLPFQPGRQSYRFTDRQASFVPRGNSFSRPFVTSGNRSSGFNRGSSGQTFPRSPGNGAGFGGQRTDWRQFGQPGRIQPGAVGAQSAPANRDSGWSRFGGNRGGASGAPIHPESGWSHFGGRGRSDMPGGPPQNAESGARFGRNGQFGRSGDAPINRDSNWSRFGNTRRGSELTNTPRQSPDAGRFGQRGEFGRSGSTPVNRDTNWSRFGGSAGFTSAPRPRTDGGRFDQGGRIGASAAPSASINRETNWNRVYTPRQSEPNRSAAESMRGFGGGRNFDRGAGFAGRSMPSAPSYSGHSFGGGRGDSGPRFSSPGGGGFAARSMPSAPSYSGHSFGGGRGGVASGGGFHGGGGGSHGGGDRHRR